MAETTTTRIYELQVKLAEESIRQLKLLQTTTKGIEDNLSATGGALKAFGGALAAAFSVKAIIGFVENTISATAELGKLALQANTTVEEISKLQGLARTSGTDFGTVTSALTGLSKALEETDFKGKVVAAALKSIGLTVAELKGLDPAQAFKKIADATEQFSDTATKNQVVMLLTGKTLAEIGPLLHTVATETNAAATATAKQAEEARKLTEDWRRLTGQAQDFSTALARDIVPWLAKMLEQMTEGTRIAGGFWKAVFTFGMTIPREPAEALKVYNTELERLNQQRARLIEQGRTGNILKNLDAEIERHRKLKEFVLLQQRQGIELPTSRMDAKDLGPKAPVVFEEPKKPGKSTKERDDAARQEKENTKIFLADLMAREEAMKKAALAGDSMTETIRKQEKALADLTGSAATEALIAKLKLIDDAFVAGKISATEAGTALEKLGTVIKPLNTELTENEKLLAHIADKVDGYAKSITSNLIDFASGAKDAKVSFGDFVTSVLRDLAKMTTQMLLVEPLLKSFKTWATSTGFGGILSTSAMGNVYDSASLSRYSGGVYDSPRMFKFAKGVGVFAEAGPEAIMPLKRGSDGSLGVDATGAGVTVNVFNETRAEVQTTSRDVNGGRVIEILVRDAVNAGIRSGAFDGVMGSTYGLNRMGAR